MKAIFVSQFKPQAVGDGGNHRAYQIVHDLQHAVGIRNVVVISLPEWRQSRPVQQASALTTTRDSLSRTACRMGQKMILPRIALRIWRRLPFLFAEHPVDLLRDTGLTTSLLSAPKFAAYYERLVQDISKPAVCVIEHAGFASLLAINSQHSIPTIGCIANIESFDRIAQFRPERKSKTYVAAIDFAEEVSVLAQCDARLFISKVEAGLIGGLGLPSQYYPYRPVGTIRQNLEGIRQTRAKHGVTPGLFLMLGSGEHTTTWESFLWFVQNARKYGLPEGVRVVVAGSRTEDLLPHGMSAPSVELKGWLEQHELDKLLMRVQAVLIPQRLGFGAVTRLPELACAGVPVIVSRHPTYAIEPTPGVHIVDECWDAWRCRMEQFTVGESYVSEDDYHAWEEKQVSTLGMVVDRSLGCFSERNCGTSEQQ